ncbi:MAG: Maf family protein [Rubrivivax sp.]
MHDFIWLASQSPHRRELLDQIGVTHRLLLPEPGEGGRTKEAAQVLRVPVSREAPWALEALQAREGLDDQDDLEALETHQPGEMPVAYVERVTALKLQAARHRLAARHTALGVPLAPILCADTTVALGRRILGKPADAQEAEATLGALSGRTHRVLTAVAVWTGRRTLRALSISRVRVAELPPAVIHRYIDSGEPFGKAGAYGIQGTMAGWISRIDGSHSGIMGLPLFETTQLLRRAQVRLGP